MAPLAILEIAGLVASALLLTCLEGFSQSPRHKKMSGVFISVEKKRRRALRGPSKTLVDSSEWQSEPAKDPGRERISSGTVAVMSLVVALGAHRMPGPTRSLSSQGENTRVPEVQPLESS